MKMLALDPATHCGWAHSCGASGTWDLSIRRDESAGMRLIRLRGKLEEIQRDAGVDLLVYEAARHSAPRMQGALVVQAMLQAMIVTFCEDHRIEYRGYSPSEIKRHAVGHGNANKREMLEAARQRWADVKTHDQADALWLLDLARQEYDAAACDIAVVPVKASLGPEGPAQGYVIDAHGLGWPARAREAARVLSAGTATEDDAKVLVLADLRDIFGDRERMPSADIVAALVSMEDRPWPEWRRGKSLSATSLARLLRAFSIRPKTIRDGSGTEKGYDRADLVDAWNRYLPPQGGDSTRNTVTNVAPQGLDPLFEPSHTPPRVTVRNGVSGGGDLFGPAAAAETGQL